LEGNLKGRDSSHHKKSTLIIIGSLNESREKVNICKNFDEKTRQMYKGGRPSGVMGELAAGYSSGAYGRVKSSSSHRANTFGKNVSQQKRGVSALRLEFAHIVREGRSTARNSCDDYPGTLPTATTENEMNRERRKDVQRTKRRRKELRWAKGCGISPGHVRDRWSEGRSVEKRSSGESRNP